MPIEPDCARDCYQAGMTALQQGNLRQAADLLRQATELESDNAKYFAHATEVFRRAGRLPEAVAAGRESIRLRPNAPAGYNNFGLALLDSGQLREAETAFRQAIDLDSQYAKAWHNLGNVLRLQQRLDEAAVVLQRALEIHPAYPQALNGLGLVMKLQHQHGCAVGHFQQALHLRPNYPQALLNLANTLGEQDRFPEAEQYLRQALAIDPQYAQALHDLGALLERQRRLPEAAAAYEKALDAKPDFLAAVASLENVRRHVCNWTDRAERIERLLRLAEDCLTRDEASPLWPAASIRFPTSNRQRFAIARQYARRISAGSRMLHNAPGTSVSAPQTKTLRIGFLSHEFGDHIVSYLMQDFYAAFDRSKFQTIGLAYSPDDGSELRRRIAGDCDRFLDLSTLPPSEAAGRIALEQIDILFDMNSYMPGGRPQIAACRPAPIQVSYRYPATMGAEWIDYILADDIVVPDDDRQFYSEQPVYLPAAYLVTSYEEPIQKNDSTRADWGLPADQFVFCSFNQCHKLDPQIFDVWMRILRRVPGSVLWQIDPTETVQDNLRREAETRGIDSQRIVFTGKLPIHEHLARIQHADLFLDCLVHGAIVTAADALWAGLPLLTILGDTFTSRAAASLLNAAGLPELIVSDLRDYEELAVHLAQHPNELASLRAKLAGNRATCPLFDTKLFVRNLEIAILKMWQIYQVGEPPRPIDVSAL